MDLFTQDDLKILLAQQPSPCVSLFMPTHRGGAEEDPVRWREHLDEAELLLLKAGWRTTDSREMLQPARQLFDDSSFWRHQCDGLAAFLAPSFLRLFRLPLSFKDEVVVSNRFAILPLLPLLTDNGRFFVLALSQKSVRLLQGTHFGISEIDLKSVPRSMAEAMPAHDRDEVLTYHTRPTSGGGWGAIFEGHGVGIDDKKEDLLVYFQRIDKGLHPFLREEKAPLVLAAVDYLQPLYRQANHYAHLLERGIDGNPDLLSSQELHDRAWPLVRPLFEETQRRLAAQYRQLQGTGYTSADLEGIVASANAGQVETLFVAQDCKVWGKFDSATGRVQRNKQRMPGDTELLDFAASRTLAQGRAVFAVKLNEVPGGNGMAAIFHHHLPKHGKRS